MIKDKIICIDFDSTIIDTSKTIINLHNKLNPNNYIEYNPNHDWNFCPMINTKEELTELFKLFDHKDFYEDVIVFPNAIEVINRLANDNEVIICSKHMESRKPLTKAWINKVMPKVKVVFVDDFADKGIEFHRADYVIDDKIESFECFSDNTLKICYGQYQWNKEWNGVRYNSWLEIEEYLNKINKISEMNRRYK